MTKTTRERKESFQQLLCLAMVQKGSKCDRKYGHDRRAELDAIGQAEMKDGVATQAILAQKVDEVGWSEVEVDVLEAEQSRKQCSAEQDCRLVPGKGKGEEEQAIHETVVLEVDMVDDEQAW